MEQVTWSHVRALTSTLSKHFTNASELLSEITRDKKMNFLPARWGNFFCLVDSAKTITAVTFWDEELGRQFTVALSRDYDIGDLFLERHVAFSLSIANRYDGTWECLDDLGVFNIPE